MNELGAPDSTVNMQFNQSDAGSADYEQRVRKFLEMTKDVESYGLQVRKFVEESSKYRKGKTSDEKTKKKDRKKSKKVKKDGKKKRKEKKSKSSKKEKDELDNKDLREALKLVLSYKFIKNVVSNVYPSLEFLRAYQYLKIQLNSVIWKRCWKSKYLNV